MVRPPIIAGMSARQAIAAASLAFADQIAGNVAGVVSDRDVESLHRLRVAVRRTRSLIKLTGDVLPDGIAAKYEPEFRWLGDLTTPTRDLDVYLPRLDELAGRLRGTEPADLDPFREYLVQLRRTERHALLTGLASERFTDLMAGWHGTLAEVRPDDAGPTVESLAADRVRRAIRRVARRAREVAPDSPPETIHALRKRCKELRYLLEVFSPVCDPRAHAAVIKDLKRVQDTLGAFQDGHVQATALRGHAEKMLATRHASAGTLLAMGELVASFAAEQAEAQRVLVYQLPEFLGPAARRRMASLVPDGAR